MWKRTVKIMKLYTCTATRYDLGASYTYIFKYTIIIDMLSPKEIITYAVL